MNDLTQAARQSALNGMFWESCATFSLPNIGDPLKATRIFHTNLAALTWNSLSRATAPDFKRFLRKRYFYIFFIDYYNILC